MFDKIVDITRNTFVFLVKHIGPSDDQQTLHFLLTIFLFKNIVSAYDDIPQLFYDTVFSKYVNEIDWSIITLEAYRSIDVIDISHIEFLIRVMHIPSRILWDFVRRNILDIDRGIITRAASYARIEGEEVDRIIETKRMENATDFNAWNF